MDLTNGLLEMAGQTTITASCCDNPSGMLRENIIPAFKVPVLMRAAVFSLRVLGCSHNNSRYLIAAPGRFTLATWVLVTSSWPQVALAFLMGLGTVSPITQKTPMDDTHLSLVIGELELYLCHFNYGSLSLVDLYTVCPWTSVMRSLVSFLVGHSGWFSVSPQGFIRSWCADYQMLGQIGLATNVLF